MRILLFGKNGQLGWELTRSLQPLGQVIALGREQADFSDPDSLREIVRNIKPDVIVNAVAYTAVDKAEDDEDLAALINSVAPGVLAEEAFRIDALLVHYSTDYVFDGAKESPYVETDVPNPINAYGRTKLGGERALQSSGCDYLIFRTSWVYASRGHNFLLTILKLAQERDELSIVADQIGSPTPARLIADATVVCLYQAIKQRQSGIFSSDLYHLTSSSSTSWHGFSEAIVSAANIHHEADFRVKNIKAIPTTDYPTPAKRPMNSCLATNGLEKRFNLLLPDWRALLSLCIEEVYG